MTNTEKDMMFEDIQIKNDDIREESADMNKDKRRRGSIILKLYDNFR